ncbi:MAG: non-canonical purine NTP pyrophosphatase [Patescibacteria group bacterium]|nr:non-canonical purine NTP pyrophosphatase [Patescibacteria group bacterium]MDE1945319.1 non-canonical purine NTP pyrophosphatase [Patescibacteria group bacterium]MDE2057571.1 non-canonical purine NTP pyrophosphatase [Patescibacteria group bacterium]
MATYFLTGSAEKFAEMRAILGAIEQLDFDLPEIQELDAKKVIEAKLNEARQHRRGAFIVEDTSLYLDGMRGLPGPLIKWFLRAVGAEGIFTLADAFGNNDAEARTIIGYAAEDGAVAFFEGAVKGTIVKPRGAGGFGWDSVFQPEGLSRTFAELSPEEKNAVSMRRLAAEKLAAFL